MTDTEWSRFVKRHKNRDSNTEVARKAGVNVSTVGRWLSGQTVADPTQVVRFARSYDQSPLAALLAAGHIDRRDIVREVSVAAPNGLDEYSTDALLKEVIERLEVMGEYAGWIRAIAAGETSPAGLGESTLRYLDPHTPPTQVQGRDFATVLAPYVGQAGDLEGDHIYQLHRANVGDPSQDIPASLLEAAGESDVRHEEDTDDYTP